MADSKHSVVLYVTLKSGARQPSLSKTYNTKGKAEERRDALQAEFAQLAEDGWWDITDLDDSQMVGVRKSEVAVLRLGIWPS